MTLILDGTNGMTAPQGAVYNGLQSGTAQATTSGTAVTFTGIPSWAKRITVMLNSIGCNTANSQYLIQIGSGSVTSTGYTSQYWTTAGSGVITSGFAIGSNLTSYTMTGVSTLCLIGSNTWVHSGALGFMNVTSTAYNSTGNSSALSGALDRVVITTVAGTALFNAGSINILYE